MFSPHQILPLVDIITEKVVTEVRRDATTDDPEKIAHNTAMYDKVMKSIDDSLEALRRNKSSREKRAPFDASAFAATEESEPAGFAAPTPSKPIGKTKEQQEAIQKVTDFLKGGTNTGAALTMKTMVDAATPILSNFDELLTQPNLDKYNATLNTSPIVGLAGRAIRYLNKTASGAGTGTITESWAHFDNLPPQADTSKGAVHMFPYNGSFYLSVGKSLWKKDPRPMSDPSRADAKNNWPKLFIGDWKPIGDNCLPADDLVTVATHASSVTAGSTPTFSLYVVGQDGKMKVFKGNDLVDNVTFKDVTMKYQKRTANIKFKQICYYAGKLYGIDSDSYSWNISVNANEPTQIELKDKKKQAAIHGLSSNEQGLVVIRDQKIYRQRVSKAVEDEATVQEDDSWSYVIDCPEITYLGVASPGSLLDLRSLTQQLRDNYLKTQIDVMPMVGTIRRSAKQHLGLLNLMEKDAAAHEAADGDEEQQEKIRQRAVDRGVKGALKIAATINRSSVNASNAIVNMGVALTGISKELTALQKVMESQLTELKQTLQSQKDALKRVEDVMFWSLVVILISFVLLILTFGVAAPYIVVGLGILFGAAFIVNKIYESKESELMSDVSKTQAAVNSLEKSLSDIKNISPRFNELEVQFKALNMFWGRMTSSSSDLMKDTKDLSDELFADMFTTLTIEFARTSAEELRNGSQMYLDMLTAQGIYLPEGDEDSGSFITLPDSPADSEDAFRAVLEAVKEPLGNGLKTDALEVTIMSGGSSSFNAPGTDNATEQNLYIPSRVQLLTEQAVVLHSNLALKALDEGDFAAFEAHMDVTTRLFDAPDTLKVDAITKSGKWFDMDMIKQAVTVWLNAGLKDLLAYNNTPLFLDGLGTISSGAVLTGAKLISASVVQDTIKLANLMHEWTSSTDQTLTDEQKAKQAEPYLESAITLCAKLASTTAKLNNSFNTINHAVVEARNKVVADLNGVNNTINSLDDLYWDKASKIQDDIPVVAAIFWSKARLTEEIIYRANQIEAARQAATQPYVLQKQALEVLRDSGYIYENHHVTWVELVQKLSVQFGRVHLTLTDIGQSLKEDVAWNAETIVSIDWPELKKNANEVFCLLNVNQTVDIFGLIESNGFSQQWTSAVATRAFFALEAPDLEHLETSEEAGFGVVEDPMQFAIQAHPVMTTLLENGTEETRKFFENVRAVMSLPYVDVLKGYETSSGAVSLQSGMAETISSYVGTFISMSTALNRIGATSALQGRRIQKLGNKSNAWPTFYKGTRQSVADASRYVGTANDEIEKSYKQVQELFRRIKTNRDAFEVKIKPVDEAIAAKKKEVDDYIFQLGADAATIMFVGAGAALAVVAGPAIAFKAAGYAYSASSHVKGYSALNTFKTFYSKMNWEEFKESMISLRIMRNSLTTAVDSLEQILLTFSDTLKYGKDLLCHLRESQARLEDFENVRSIRFATVEKRGEDSSIVLNDYLGDVDFEEVAKGWFAVQDGCDQWNDMFHAQGFALPSEFEL